MREWWTRWTPTLTFLDRAAATTSESPPAAGGPPPAVHDRDEQLEPPARPQAPRSGNAYARVLINKR
jgi:hypothetical protein